MADNRITIRGIPRDVWHKAKVAAISSDKSVGEFVTEALRDKLAKPPKR